MAELIEIEAPDGTAEAYLARPDGPGRGGVLFYMDVFGLRPRIAEMVEEIASWGYVVLAPNVFYRDGSVETLAPTGDLRVEGAEKAFFGAGGRSRIAGLTPDRVAIDVPAYAAALSEYAGDVPFATTGYCMGARLAVRTAGLLPERVVAVGGFHGGGLVTDEPSSPHRQIAGTRAEYLFGHADHDRSMAPEHVALLDEALAEAGVRATNEIYAGAAHGYTMADTTSWNAAATERHFTALRGLLDRTLGG